MHATSLVETSQAPGRLAQLGLTAALLREAVERGEFARASCTANDPATASGYLAWGRTLRALRELLGPDGWVANREGGLETVIDPKGRMAIAVSTGNEFTGLRASPGTKHPKGSATTTAVGRNVVQLELFALAGAVSVQATDRTTWILLISRAEDEVRCELSLPSAVSPGGMVETWAERILLEPVRLQPGPTTPAREPETDIVVEVVRRVG